MEIKMVTTLDKGIYQSDREAWAVPETMEATKANLSYMLDWRDYRLLDTKGCFGGIGMGTTEVFLVDDEENEILVTDENEDTVYSSIEEEGELSRDDLNEITGKVWDGNNHVFFYPKRSEQYCDEDEIEYYAWGHVKYNDEHTFNGIDVSPGWVLLGGIDQYYWDDGELSRDEFDELLEMDEPPSDIEKFTDDENDTVALFATEKNYKVIRKYFNDR
jgi:hypothetical protein